ncbi:MAG: DMT family transporter [Candidatus Thermoplasmatota archaeon]|jgi:drug/metabolite transporter (DMT)-like permease|nr:DMT family transporter [Candidatus Thermoplasmatota archaeon]
MDRKIAYGSLVIVAVVWGATFPIIKLSLTYIDPISFLIFRFAIAAVVLLPFVIKKMNKRDAIYGTIVGIPLFLGYVTQTVGLQYTSPSMSGLITGIYIVLTPILSIFILRNGLDMVKIYLAVAAFVGMALMTISSTSGEALGNLLTIATAFCYALQLVLTEKYLKTGNPLVFTFFQLIVVAVLSLLISPGSVLKAGILTNSYVLFSVLFNAILGSTMAIWLMSVAIKNTNAYISALILIIEPVSAVMVSTVFFHFPVTTLMIIGGAIILVSMVLAINRENKKI